MQKCSGSVPASSLRASGDGDRACQLLPWHSADCLLPTRLVEGKMERGTVGMCREVTEPGLSHFPSVTPGASLNVFC